MLLYNSNLYKSNPLDFYNTLLLQLLVWPVYVLSASIVRILITIMLMIAPHYDTRYQYLPPIPSNPDCLTLPGTFIFWLCSLSDIPSNSWHTQTISEWIKLHFVMPQTTENSFVANPNPQHHPQPFLPKIAQHIPAPYSSPPHFITPLYLPNPDLGRTTRPIPNPSK